MPKHNKKTLRRSRKKGRKNEKKTRKNIKKGGFLFGRGSNKTYKFTTTIDDETLERMKKLIGLDNAKAAMNRVFEKVAEKMDVSNIRITEYKYRNNLQIKDLLGIDATDTDAHYGMFQKIIDNENIKKRIIAMFAIILNYGNKNKYIFRESITKEYNSIKYVLNENNDKSLYWMVEYEPNKKDIPKQIIPEEIITKENIFMFQFKDYGFIKNTPGFRFSILKEGKTAFSREKSERPDKFKEEQFNRLYIFPTAKIERVTL